MALTKVRPPVSDISSISWGSTDASIPVASGDLVITVAGAEIATFSATGVDLGALAVGALEVDAQDVNVVNGTVIGQVHADATEVVVGTTSAHPLSLIANSVEGLLIGTDGKVTLGVEGTAVGHLVTKAYVDSVVNLASSIDGNAASSGHISIPNSSGDDIIINWGSDSGSKSALIPIVFDEPFPNAALCAVATRNNSSSSIDRTVNVANVTTTGMDVRNNSNGSTDFYWLAIGY
jgi:hypothetical protein